MKAGGTTWQYLIHAGQFCGFKGSSGPFQSVGLIVGLCCSTPFSGSSVSLVGLDNSNFELLCLSCDATEAALRLLPSADMVYRVE